jgi:nitrate/TMAO reductase-like tetraheme cytochrome c subunit
MAAASRPIPLFGLVLLATLAASAGTAAAAPPGTAPRSAKVCAACHSAIHKAWQASSKAHSWTNPVFQWGLADARKTQGEAVVARCVACHAPLATGAPGGEDAVAQEGTTCNFCHNVSAVEASPKPASYTLDKAKPNLMRGPYADADAGSGHESVLHEGFTKGEFCASCHWGQMENGLIIEATYPQWKASRAAASGQQCQDCHMPSAPGKASPLAKKQRPAVFAHTFSGPRTPDGLDSVATLAASVEGGRLKLTVTNARGGHSLPGGGHSMRAITLVVVFTDAAGKELSRAEIASYGTEFADTAGRAPVPKWLAASVARSREIPADSPVVEYAKVPAGAKKAEAVLTYHPLAPAILERLKTAGVEVAGRDPVVLARAAASLP